MLIRIIQSWLRRARWFLLGAVIGVVAGDLLNGNWLASLKGFAVIFLISGILYFALASRNR